MVLDDVKVLKGYLDTSKDALINVYIRLGADAIKDYLHCGDIDIEANYSSALIQYCIEKLNNKGLEGQKQFSQGGRSGTINNSLSQDVKDLLPTPYVTLA